MSIMTNVTGRNIAALIIVGIIVIILVSIPDSVLGTATDPTPDTVVTKPNGIIFACVFVPSVAIVGTIIESRRGLQQYSDVKEVRTLVYINIVVAIIIFAIIVLTLVHEFITPIYSSPLITTESIVGVGATIAIITTVSNIWATRNIEKQHIEHAPF